jgi:ferredoxin--NADP+ reductase
MVDRRLGIPGEDLPGSVAATDFVNWYCGHPDAEDQTFDLSAGEVAVIGVGNVAVDVARILARQPDDLHPTDVPEAALKHLRDSRVRRVHVVGRRGPVHAKFTPKELRELGRLTGVSVHVDPRDMPDDEFAAQAEGAERSARVNLTVLREWAERPGDAAERRIDVHFWSRPVEILGTDRVEGLRLERTQLVDGRVAGTGEFETLRVGMVLRSVGYQSVPLPGVPFDEATKRIPNEAGRVLDGAGRPSPGEYVAGWIKRGPTGVVGTNKSDAAETVRSMLADLAEAPADGTKAGGIEAVLAARGVPVVDYASWLGIDAAEIALAESLGRGARVKLAGWEALRTASKR